MSETSTHQILNQRAKTHGDFGAKAIFIQDMKIAMRQTPNWMEGHLESRQEEALDMIATKIGRILYGDCSERDHWVDLSGYANLGGGWKP